MGQQCQSHGLYQSSLAPYWGGSAGSGSPPLPDPSCGVGDVHVSLHPCWDVASCPEGSPTTQTTFFLREEIAKAIAQKRGGLDGDEKVPGSSRVSPSPKPTEQRALGWQPSRCPCPFAVAEQQIPVP